MREVYIAGIGMTPFGRAPDQTVKNLTKLAVSASLSDAGLPQSRIEAIFYSNTSQSSLEGQYMIGAKSHYAPSASTLFRS